LQKLAASHLSTEKCLTESSSLIDKFVHQNRQLLQAAKRWQQYKNETLGRNSSWLHVQSAKEPT